MDQEQHAANGLLALHGRGHHKGLLAIGVTAHVGLHELGRQGMKAPRLPLLVFALEQPLHILGAGSHVHLQSPLVFGPHQPVSPLAIHGRPQHVQRLREVQHHGRITGHDPLHAFEFGRIDFAGRLLRRKHRGSPRPCRNAPLEQPPSLLAQGRCGLRRPHRSAAARSQADVERQTTALELRQPQHLVALAQHGPVDYHPQLLQGLSVSPALLQAALVASVKVHPFVVGVGVPAHIHGNILISLGLRHGDSSSFFPCRIQ